MRRVNICDMTSTCTLTEVTCMCPAGCSERALWECPGSKVCIKASMICDGFADCPLLVDETNCCECVCSASC